jgi:hypothetical protein
MVNPIKIYKIINKLASNTKFINLFPNLSSLKHPKNENITDKTPIMVKKINVMIFDKTQKVIEESVKVPHKNNSIFSYLTIETGNCTKKLNPNHGFEALPKKIPIGRNGNNKTMLANNPEMKPNLFIINLSVVSISKYDLELNKSF